MSWWSRVNRPIIAMLAVWDKWFPVLHMQDTIERGRHKLASARLSWWSRVSGPIIDMLAAARRIN